MDPLALIETTSLSRWEAQWEANHAGTCLPPSLWYHRSSLSLCIILNIIYKLYIYYIFNIIHIIYLYAQLQYCTHFSLSAGKLPCYASEHPHHIILPITLKLKCHVIFSTVGSKCYLTLHSIISLYFPPCLISCQYCFAMRNFHLMHQMISMTFKRVASKIIYSHCGDKVISLLPRSCDTIITWFPPNDLIFAYLGCWSPLWKIEITKLLIIPVNYKELKGLLSIASPGSTARIPTLCLRPFCTFFSSNCSAFCKERFNTISFAVSCISRRMRSQISHPFGIFLALCA